MLHPLINRITRRYLFAIQLFIVCVCECVSEYVCVCVSECVCLCMRAFVRAFVCLCGV